MSSFGPEHIGATAFASANQATLQDNFNVSSTTDNQAADTSFNYSTSMDNDDYAIFGQSLGPSSGAQAAITSVHSRSTSGCRMICFDEAKNSNGRFDTAYQSMGTVGDT
tara:strand:- start:312 stop:638 length:327 start_codon:yes stop_codon:yes gene_type:complete